ncbi:MAG: protein phosphatase 2C domain-containing protein [Chromatiales bacterium]
MAARYELGQATDIGDRRKNQDRSGIAELDDGVLLALADGMGGHPKGERAAEVVVETSTRLFRRARRPLRDHAALLEGMLLRAHDRVVAFGRSQRPPVDPRSTATLALIDGNQLHWAHLGDSRLYLYRRGDLIAHTTDHSYVEKLRQQGVINAEELHQHPFRNYVTRCIGGSLPPPEPTLGGPVDLEPGDVLVLCSDGLWGSLSTDEIGAALEEGRGLPDATAGLVRRAVDAAGPGGDNVTALTLRWLAVPEKTVAEEAEDELTHAIHDIRAALRAFEAENEREK